MKKYLVALSAGILLGLFSHTLHAEEAIILPGSPALSPDGKLLAFSYAGDVWLSPAQGGQAKRMTVHAASDGQPAFSPDGKQLAFVSTRTGTAQAYVISLENGKPEQKTFHTEGCSLQQWSPDGERLLLSGSRDHFWKHAERFFEVSAKKRSVEKVLFDAYGSDGRLSADGKKLLFVREGSRWWRKGYQGSQAAQIWLFNREDNSFKQIISEPGGARWPMWKPDGSGFYYVSQNSGSFNLYEYDFKSKKKTARTSFKDDAVVYPCISRNGSVIVLRHLFDFYRLETAKKEPPRKISLTQSGDSPYEKKLRRSITSTSNASFTSDGLEIAFIAGGDLWVMDTELKEPVAIASTAFEESEPLWVNEGKTLLFLREEQGQVDLYKAERKEPNKYWWQNSEFQITRLTNDAETDSNILASPDGKHIGIVKQRGDLWITDLDGKNGKKIVSGFTSPQYRFSPDGRWIAYAQSDNNFNSDIWIVPSDGSRKPVNISRHPDNEYNPVWSPDGKIIAFTGRRHAEETDIYYVYLDKTDEDKTSRDRKLKKALEKIRKVRGTPATSKKKAPSKEEAKKKPEKDKKNTLKKMPAEIDFDQIHERLHHISIPDAHETNLFWFAEGNTLGFSATIKGVSGTYTLEIPTRTTPKKISSSTGYVFNRLKDKKRVSWISKGKLGTLTATGTTESFSFSVKQEMNVAQRYRAGFDVAWRLMRDNWYDSNFGNRNWDAIRRKYTDAAAASPDANSLATVMQLMLGELNGSHLGYYPRGNSTPSAAWRPVTAHLGLRFAPAYKGPGLKIRDVILNGPCDKDNISVEPGEILLSIDGTAIDPELELTALLNGSLNRDIQLTIQNAKKVKRTITIRPASYGTIRNLLYRQWISQNRKIVDEKSGGSIGYLHIKLMLTSSFLEFERELYNVGYGKDAIVIDVRENGGGFTTDHLLTALTQPRHAITVPRGGGQGYPHDRMIYATWHKPIIVLCNQNSFSNAEIFSHAIKYLKRGKLVGVTTAGGVISTGRANVMDLGALRQPFRGWFLVGTGEDMELNGAVPDLEIWPQPGEWPSGADRQLEASLDLLKKDIEQWKKRPRKPLLKATERK